MVAILRKLGHSVLTSYEAGQANQGIPDEALITYATHRQRVIITLNRQDFIQLHRSGIDHSGIVICKDDRSYINQMRTLHQYLQSQTSFANRLIRVKKQNRPKSSQQIFVIQEY